MNCLTRTVLHPGDACNSVILGAILPRRVLPRINPSPRTRSESRLTNGSRFPSPLARISTELAHLTTLIDRVIGLPSKSLKFYASRELRANFSQPGAIIPLLHAKILDLAFKNSVTSSTVDLWLPYWPLPPRLRYWKQTQPWRKRKRERGRNRESTILLSRGTTKIVLASVSFVRMHTSRFTENP